MRTRHRVLRIMSVAGAGNAGPLVGTSAAATATPPSFAVVGSPIASTPHRFTIVGVPPTPQPPGPPSCNNLPAVAGASACLTPGLESGPCTDGTAYSPDRGECVPISGDRQRA
jgi:hypothetical protein